MSDWKAPTSMSLDFHNFDSMTFEQSVAVPGCLNIRLRREGYETVKLSFFTGRPESVAALIKGIDSCR